MVSREELNLAREHGARIVTLQGDDYPALLRQIQRPPPVLYVRGSLLEADGAAVAIVGTRRATPYGLSAARELAGDLARAGITVVSGLAEGIDAAAHEGALEAGGRTIAVVGHGLSTLYPARHAKLAERIAGSGAVISEFPMTMPPLAHNFPLRNRVIAGLSLAVLVVEAPEKSGALITAREAADQGREVFAVPGPITSHASRGANGLLRDGAGVVTSAEDILQPLAMKLQEILSRYRVPGTGLGDRYQVPKGGFVPGTVLELAMPAEEGRVFEQVPAGASASVDALASSTGLPAARLLPILTELEIKGVVRQMPGKGFTRSR
ncbi:MAG: DNA-protecting protein DprA [Candidatus Omnitrophica bacterium]|nr:DNA-protecting protein DprA [Candidatus Omnitrophota bacterium]